MVFTLLSRCCLWRPDVSGHDEALSLFIPVTFHQEGEKRYLKGIRGKNDLQSLRERQAHSMPRPPSLQRNKRYSGRPETPTTWLQWGWQGRLDQGDQVLHLDPPAEFDGDWESRMYTQNTY